MSLSLFPHTGAMKEAETSGCMNNGKRRGGTGEGEGVRSSYGDLVIPQLDPVHKLPGDKRALKRSCPEFPGDTEVTGPGFCCKEPGMG